MTVTTTDTCRSCGAAPLVPVLDLGLHPLANDYRDTADAAQAAARYPLRLGLCTTCSLIQLLDTVAPPDMFADYPYFSSTVSAVVDHARALARQVVDELELRPGQLVAEVASNDGYLLKEYQQLGLRVQGIDPASNIADVAQRAGVPTVCEFFGRSTGVRLAQEERAAVIHASNVLAHVPDVNDFVGGLSAYLAHDGTLIVETPHVVPFVDHCEFDTTYHEHVFCYSLTALTDLFARHGLVVGRVEEDPGYHGGTLRLWVGHRGVVAVDPSVTAMLAREASWGVADPARYADFAERVDALGADLRHLLRDLRRGGAVVAAYGAAAKGNTLLNTFGIGCDLVDFVVDDSPHKQGLFMPGSGLPILHPDALVERKADYVVILAWNFAEVIMTKQRAYAQAGGSFVVPVPTVEVLHP